MISIKITVICYPISGMKWINLGKRVHGIYMA